MNAKEWEANFNAHIPTGYPNLMCGWPDEVFGITWESYINWAHDLLDELEEGADIGEFLGFSEWCQMKRDEEPGNLGFSHGKCDLCDGLAGDRFAVTAYDAELKDYHVLACCGDCLQYIANGELPNDLED